MIEVKETLSKKHKLKVWSLIQTLNDFYSDFYLTKNNLRLHIKENFNVLIKNLKNGDKIIFCDEGIGLVVGWADKNKRKYVKLLAKNTHYADKLLKVILWNFSNVDLFVKLKWKNPMRKVFYDNGFNFFGGRGSEVLLIRKKTFEKFRINKGESRDKKDTEKTAKSNRR
jgi:hypothetical protein